MDCFPLKGFNHVTNIGVLICDLFVEAFAQGVQSFGSTLCTRTWYQSVYEEPLLVLIKIWNRCCQNFEMVSISGVSMHFWPMGVVPLCPECRFHWEIVFFY